MLERDRASTCKLLPRTALEALSLTDLVLRMCLSNCHDNFDTFFIIHLFSNLIISMSTLFAAPLSRRQPVTNSSIVMMPELSTSSNLNSCQASMTVSSRESKYAFREGSSSASSNSTSVKCAD
eukprot:gnl/TRDRNA2_/TRDRNA2_68028_c0_seq2.p1 gnl/TRDRNA2_/TRDRNA2_68028_c0~~gnl/TRDRNA2_/TRDRNA2_68028_c0_seq2.p1  ORF type:complete len:123 (+),score=13.60 gnl/TRDRNA2_/TRDRNA2_68028_c0_seq2:200-568(+)